MNTLVVTVLGMIAGCGVLLIALGARRAAPDGARQDRPATHTTRFVLDARAAAAILAAVAGFAITRWPIATLLAALAVWAAPELRRAQQRRAEAMARTEAVAAWCEQLRDSIRAAAGLHEAIASTAGLAPAPIRPHVERLAVRLRREPLRVAMADFARSVADPTADKIATALVLASERRSANLADLLSEVAATARQHATMQLRVDASRARLYTQTLIVCAITAAVIATLVLFNRSYLAPYDSIEGQAMLAVIGGLFAACGVGLLRLGQPSSAPRVLTLDAEHRP